MTEVPSMSINLPLEQLLLAARLFMILTESKTMDSSCSSVLVEVIPILLLEETRAVPVPSDAKVSERSTALQLETCFVLEFSNFNADDNEENP